MNALQMFGSAALVILVILVLLVLLWLLSLALKNSSIIDIFWGAGFVIANWIYFALAPDGFAPRKLLLGALGKTGFNRFGWER